MPTEQATSVAAANAQDFTLPAQLDDWRPFAALLDGYKIAEELGLKLADWANVQQKHYEQTGQWDLSVLELRLMLFFQFRADYWTGYTYDERDDVVDSLLRALSQETGKPFPSMTTGA